MVMGVYLKSVEIVGLSSERKERGAILKSLCRAGTCERYPGGPWQPPFGAASPLASACTTDSIYQTISCHPKKHLILRYGVGG